MNENNEHYDSNETSDTERTALSDEINTYDSPFVIVNTSTSQESEALPKSTCSAFYSLYRVAAIIAVVMTLIFATSEFMDFLLSDMGTGNTLLRRIFGTDASGSGENMYELIINQTFTDMSAGKNEPPQTFPPSTSVQEPNQAVPVPPETKPSESVAPPESDPPSQSTPAPETDPDKVDPSLPENCYPIISMDMSLLSYGNGFIYNNTSLSPNVQELLSKELKKIEASSEPLVLVIHTHGTEAFMPEGATYYSDEGEIARSSNTEENMIAVGSEFVRVLESNGISTLHCVIMHDAESYRESYSRAAETIAWYLKKYPSIKYVFDLHRDSLMKSSGELISAETTVNGKSCAQVMPVVGSGFDGYEDNLSFALKLREKLNSKYSSLSRPVCLRESQYNQSMAPVSILLEIGTSGNTLSEAKLAAALTAEAVAELIMLQTER